MAAWPGILHSGKFLERFDPPTYVLDRVIQQGYLYTVTGMTGSGKTAVALRLAAHAGLGLAFGGVKMRRGLVLYLAGENPMDVQMRWAAMANQMPFNPKTIPVLFAPGSYNLDVWMSQTREMVEPHGPVMLVIVDTQMAYFPGDNDNDNSQMQDYADRLRDFTKFPGKPAVLVLTHPSKNNNRVLVPRGGSAFLNAVDGNLTIRRRAEEQYVRLHWAEKFRGPPFPEMKVALERIEGPMKDAEGRTLPTIIGRPISDDEARELDNASGEDEVLVLQACKDFPGHGYRRLADELGWYIDNGKPNHSRVYRAISRLVAKGELEWTGKRGKNACGWQLPVMFANVRSPSSDTPEAS